MDAETPRVTVGGDPAGGWSVDVHDGTHFGVYSPEAGSAEEAKSAALDMHADAVKKASESPGGVAGFPPSSLSHMLDEVRAEFSVGFAQFKTWAEGRLAEHADLISDAHAKIDEVKADIDGMQTPRNRPPAEPPHEEGAGGTA